MNTIRERLEFENTYVLVKKTYYSHEEMTQLTCARLVTFMYLKFTQMLI